MNDDLISRSALKKAITDATYNFEQIPIRVDKVKEIIDNAPTVEFPEQITVKCDTEEDRQKLLSALRNARVTRVVEEERPQGEWQLHGMIYYCSECEHEIISAKELPNYCQNCGAKMKGIYNEQKTTDTSI